MLAAESREDRAMVLQGKTALVTGAGSGIGRAIALAYAREGASQVLSDIDEAACHETARMIDDAVSDAEVHMVAGDVTQPEHHDALVRAAVDRFGRLDIACNNAGIGGDLKPVAEIDVDAWQRVLDVNLSGVFYGMRVQIPAMLNAGGGAIVNMGSIMSTVATPGASAYVAAKHGLLGLTRTAALEYAAAGVRINAVGPAFIDTPLLAGLPAELHGQLVALHPLGRLGRAPEVAELVVWLSSESASFATGGYYPIDGGYLAR
jgi:NAD(P)-dependent dehydrogenase (short-subunit alcohol dehydrogenase family)